MCSKLLNYATGLMHYMVDLCTTMILFIYYMQTEPRTPALNNGMAMLRSPAVIFEEQIDNSISEFSQAQLQTVQALINENFSMA